MGFRLWGIGVYVAYAAYIPTYMHAYIPTGTQYTSLHTHINNHTFIHAFSQSVRQTDVLTGLLRDLEAYAESLSTNATLFPETPKPYILNP